MAKLGAMPTTPSDRQLQELTDRARAEQAAEARRRQRSLLAQAGEEGSFAGVLADLAERGGAVAVHTHAGRLVRGVIGAIGVDYVGLIGARGERTWVPRHAVTGLRPEPGTRATVGDRSGRWAASWHAVVVDLASERTTVALYTVGGDRIPGRLWTAGQDVVSIRAGADVLSYVPMSSINDVTLT